MTLQLADYSIIHPVGILEDIPIKVGKQIILANFDVMEMEEDSQVPIIFGKSFLATASAIIDVKHGKLAFNVYEEKIEFEISNLMKSLSHDCLHDPN